MLTVTTQEHRASRHYQNSDHRPQQMYRSQLKAARSEIPRIVTYRRFGHKSSVSDWESA